MNANVTLNMEERAIILNRILADLDAEFTIFYTKIWKNNMEREGYVLRSPDSNCSPTVYYDQSWYDQDDAKVITYLKEMHHSHSMQMDLNHVLDRDYILSNVKPRLVSNHNLMIIDKEDLAYIEFLDMLILFYVPVEVFVDGMGSIQVKQDLLKQVNLSMEEIYNASISNLEKDAEVKTMQEVLCADMGLSPELMEDDESYMWVGTTKNKIQGSATMLCRTVRESLETKIGGKVAILPSSVHEFIAVPYESESQFRVLRDLVMQVNSTQVSAEDKLTDSVYFVSDGELRLAV